MGPIRWLQKWMQDIQRIETYRAEAYAKGCDDTANRFIEQQSQMTDKIRQLTQQNIDNERRIRHDADDRVAHADEMHAMKCKQCRENMEDERQRLRRRQGMLADKMVRVDELVIRLLQHSNVIVDEHDNILRSSSRIVSHRNILVDFKHEVDSIMSDAAPLLSIELTDAGEDKTVELTSEEPKAQASRRN